jgi:hypothetical protein
VDAVEALLLRRRVPRGVEQEQAAGGGQVEADATCGNRGMIWGAKEMRK